RRRCVPAVRTLFLTGQATPWGGGLARSFHSVTAHPLGTPSSGKSGTKSSAGRAAPVRVLLNATTAARKASVFTATSGCGGGRHGQVTEPATGRPGRRRSDRAAPSRGG